MTPKLCIYFVCVFWIVDRLLSDSVDIDATLYVFSCCSGGCGVVEQVVDHFVVANARQYAKRSDFRHFL